MELFDNLNVKVPNAVLVSGVTGTENDEEVLGFLGTYGSVNRILTIDDTNSEFYNHLIVEYSHGTALEVLDDVLPYTYSRKNNPNITYHIQALAAVYTQNVGNSITENYLDKLKGIAKLSGKDFEEVLRVVMSKIEESIEGTEPSEQSSSLQQADKLKPTLAVCQPKTPSKLPAGVGVPLLFKPKQTDQWGPPFSPKLTPSPQAAASHSAKTSLTLSPSELNPPEVQKIVVEHIVRSENKSAHSHSAIRLRTFSGKTPRPHSEVDYDTWHSHVDLMMKDTSISDLEKSRKILESLLVPASDIIRHLGPEAPPTDYLHLLDSAFATVEDGEELFVRFMNTLQDSGEKASTYLQRLQVALSNTVRRGGISVHEADRQLLKQFCRGCWDNSLLADLQLEHKKVNPPSFAELLLLLRTEEDKQEAKALRMRRHLSVSKQRVSSQVHNVNLHETENIDSNSITELKKQVADLKSQLTSLMKKKKTTSRESSKVRESQKPDNANAEFQNSKNTQSKPKPWYCFRCGEDGHISTNCVSDTNPALVAAKRKELRERQQLWEMQNSSTPSLN